MKRAGSRLRPSSQRTRRVPSRSIGAGSFKKGFTSRSVGRLALDADAADQAEEPIRERLERFGRTELDLGGEDRGVALERGLGAEREPDAAAVVQTAAGDEPIEARELVEGASQRVEDDVEEGDRPLGGPIGVQAGQQPSCRLDVDLLFEHDDRLRPGRHDERHDPADRVEVRHRGPVGASAERHGPGVLPCASGRSNTPNAPELDGAGLGGCVRRGTCRCPASTSATSAASVDQLGKADEQLPLLGANVGLEQVGERRRAAARARRRRRRRRATRPGNGGDRARRPDA